MTYTVHLIQDAEDDLLDIFHYVKIHDSISKAQNLLEKLREICLSLSSSPGRGHCPPELEWVGIREYREIHFKPYRIIYTTHKKSIYIHAVLDGRRDVMELLERRLLR